MINSEVNYNYGQQQPGCHSNLQSRARAVGPQPLCRPCSFPTWQRQPGTHTFPQTWPGSQQSSRGVWEEVAGAPEPPPIPVT